MDTGEIDKISFISESIYNGNNGSNSNEDNWSVAGSIKHFDISLPGPSTAPGRERSKCLILPATDQLSSLLLLPLLPL